MHTCDESYHHYEFPILIGGEEFTSFELMLYKARTVNEVNKPKVIKK